MENTLTHKIVLYIYFLPLVDRPDGPALFLRSSSFLLTNFIMLLFFAFYLVSAASTTMHNTITTDGRFFYVAFLSFLRREETVHSSLFLWHVFQDQTRTRTTATETSVFSHSRFGND